MEAATPEVGAFPSPFSIETPQGCEGWEEMYPYWSLFDEQRKEAASQYLAGGRPELAQNENAEITILETYLPRQLTDAELLALVRESVAASGAKDAKDMGAVMKVLMPKIAGRAEGKRVSDAVKSALSKPAS